MGTNTNIIKFFRFYSKLLKMSDVGKCHRVGFLGIVRGTQTLLAKLGMAIRHNSDLQWGKWEGGRGEVPDIKSPQTPRIVLVPQPYFPSKDISILQTLPASEKPP